MQDNVSVLIATIVAVIIIVLFPIYNIATRQDSIANNMVVRATTNFVDEVRNKGYVDKESYGNFLKELDKTGNTYEVEMEVYKPILLAQDDSLEEYEEKYEIDYTNDILADMDNEFLYKDAGSVKKNNAYYLYEDYKFYVRVKNTNVTQAQILLDRLIGGKQDERIVVNYGGIVYDNEWAMGEGAENSEVSISISRPLDYQEKEYTYKYIASSFDPVTGQTDNLYAIAVELDDNDPNSGIINFKLRYTRVQFRDDNGNVLIDVTEIENHVERYLELYGTEDIEMNVNDVIVQSRGITEKNGYYDAEFLVTLKNIGYNFNANPYIKTKARVRTGSAYSEAGRVGELNSSEFIIFYDVNLPEVGNFNGYTVADNKEVTEGMVVEQDLAQVDIKFTADASVVSNVSTVKKFIFEIHDGKNEPYTEEVNADGTSSASITKTFYRGSCYVKVCAVDSKGAKSEQKEINFKVDYIRPRIQIISNPDFTTNSKELTYPAKLEFNSRGYSGTGWNLYIPVTLKTTISHPSATIEKIVCEYTNSSLSGMTKETLYDSETVVNLTYYFDTLLKKGKNQDLKFSVYAVDSRGVQSEKYEYSYKIKYIKRTASLSFSCSACEYDNIRSWGENGWEWDYKLVCPEYKSTNFGTTYYYAGETVDSCSYTGSTSNTTISYGYSEDNNGDKKYKRVSVSATGRANDLLSSSYAYIDFSVIYVIDYLD